MKHRITSNLTNILGIQAEHIPAAIAINSPSESLSYKQLDKLVWKSAAFLHKHGICSSDVVALTFESELIHIITMLAIARMGATVFSIPANTPALERKELLHKTKAKVSITDIIEENASDLFLDLKTLTEFPFPIDENIYIDAPLSPWIIVSGSGSTGKSKLIPVTHQQQIERMKLSFHSFSITGEERFASLVHIDHYTTKLLLLSAFQSGISITLFDRKHTKILSLYDTLNINIMYMTVYHLQSLIATLPAGTKNRMKDLKALLVAGSFVSDPLRQKVSAMLSKQLFIGYGTNETGSTVRSAPPASYNTAGTVGYPLPGLTVEVVDKEDHAVSPEEIGYIRIKGATMIDGYLDDEAATQKAFKGEWFFPGDLGKMTKEGELIHLGRADDMMIMNGINIYPAEIEHVITKHPDVEDAIAMPVKSDLHQDIPICAVSLSKNSKLSEQTLLDFTFAYLGVRSPKKVLIVSTIPRNEQGKLMRKEMVHMINKQLNDSMTEETFSRKYAQLTQMFTLKLHKNVPSTLTHIDDWMTSVLHVNIELSRCSMPKHLTQRLDHSIELMWRILLLSKTLLQSIRIPIFYTGEILKIDDSHTEHYNIHFLFGHIDHIPKNVYLHAFRLSSHLILNFMKRPITDENTQILFQMMKNRFIDTHSRVSGSGKSTMPILQEAYQQNIPFIHLKNGIYQLGWGSKAKRINRSSTELDSSIGSMMSHNKIMTALLLQEAGLPAAVHKVARSQEEVLLAAKDLGWPLVVKPSDADRGEGVTIDVTDETILQKAFTIAQESSKSKRVLIEKQVDGVCCRIFIANEKMLYAVKRLPKSVKGDGKHSVKELIAEANRLENSMPPWKKSEIFPFDDLAIEAMHLTGFKNDSIPKDGKLVPLRKIESTQWGGVDEDITNIIHPDNLDLSLRATKLFGLNVAGIDIITSDIRIPWYLNGAIINEVNYSPQYGGGEISRNTISTYLHDLIQESGRIPITVIVGDAQAMELANKIQTEQLNNRIQPFITNHKTSLSPAGKEVYFTHKSLFKRSRALLLDPLVEALILVVQTDEFLQTGLPLDSIDNLIVDTNDLYHYENTKEKLSKQRFAQLLSLLKTIAY